MPDLCVSGPQASLLAALVQASQDMIAAVDRHSRCVVLNPAFQRTIAELYGRVPAVGMTLQEVFGHGPDDLAQILAMYHRILAGEPVSGRSVIGPPGRQRTVEVSGLPLRDDGESISGAAVILKDVTEQVTLQATLQRLTDELAGTAAPRQDLLAALMHHAPVGVGFFDWDLRFITVNTALAAMNGPSVAEHLGRRVREVLPDIGTEVETYMREVFRTGQPLWRHDIGGETPAARHVQRHWQAVYFPVFDPQGRVGAVGVVVIEDTERHEVVEALRLATEEAQRHLARLEAVLGEREELLARMQKALAVRDDFLSVASHELRTPVTIVALQLGLLLRQVERATDGSIPVAQFEPKLHGLQRYLDRLTHLVLGLLDVTRLESGHLELDLQPVDLGGLVQDAAERHHEVAALSGCTLETEAPAGVVVIGDQGRLEQILSNLLTNAGKYGHGHPISLRVTARGQMGAIQVTDQGPGIPKDDQERIFGRFERATPGRQIAGLGLGLYIAREFARAMGGEITVDSEPGHGATFTVSLPAAPK
jgi:PAS domain S-box-containing protein